MAGFTLIELKRIMRQSGGEGDVDLDGDIAGMSFADLGYDSLALLEMSAVIQQEYEVEVPDGALDPQTTPQGAVDLVTQLTVAH